MNRPLTPSLSPSEGERVPEGRVRGRAGRFRGAWAHKIRGILSYKSCTTRCNSASVL